MEVVWLDRDDVLFLVERLRDEDVRATLVRSVDSIDQGSDRGEDVGITFRRDQIEKVLEGLAELLSEIGLEIDGEPNRTGLRIEELIDVFNRKYWSK